METGKVRLGDRSYKVVIASDSESRAEGLKHIKELPSNIGMFFIHDSAARHGYWMAETYIPLSIIYINNNLKVVDIIHRYDINTLTLTRPDKPAKYVLEVNLDESLDKLIGEKLTIGGSYE